VSESSREVSSTLVADRDDIMKTLLSHEKKPSATATATATTVGATGGASTQSSSSDSDADDISYSGNY